ncbi:MAG: uncharacterized protein JWQ35_658 [Bacteriovoracaceae bacterium]|nr:uncharacterized protein [Bacteriovoracaceae bacterium]
MRAHEFEKVRSWEHFSHEADIGIRGFGKTPEEAFENAAFALLCVVTDPEKVEPKNSIFIECVAKSYEFLFYDWINALIYEMDIRDMLFSRFKVQIDENFTLNAEVFGEPMDQKRFEPAVYIKGATFTELKFFENEGTFVAQCVVDV